MGETLVVRFDIRDRKAAGVLWAAHAKGELIHGCKVTGLTWEDLFEKDILCIHEECEECHRELKWDQRTAEIEASKARNVCKCAGQTETGEHLIGCPAQDIVEGEKK